MNDDGIVPEDYPQAVANQVSSELGRKLTIEELRVLVKAVEIVSTDMY